MNFLKKWLKKKLGITALEKFKAAQEAELEHYARYDADIGVRGNNTIVLTGTYRGHGYVRFYDLSDENFHHMVERMRGMRTMLRNIDCPPQLQGKFRI